MPGRHRKHGPGFILGIGAFLVIAAFALLAGIMLAGAHSAGVAPVAVPLPSPSMSSPGSPASAPRPGVHVVQPGENLWGIAQAWCGTATAWQALYAANRQAVGPDPYVVTAGTRLVLACGPYNSPRGGTQP